MQIKPEERENPVLGISSKVSNKISALSFACILLVVGIHIGMPEWSRALYQAAVPIYFCISGYLLAGHVYEPQWWKRECLKRIRTLLVPYCMWCALYFVFQAILSGNYGVAKATIVWIFGLRLDGYPMLFPLWFVRALMIYVVLSPCFVWMARRFWLYGVVVICLLDCLVPVSGVLKFVPLLGAASFLMGMCLRLKPLEFAATPELWVVLVLMGILCPWKPLACASMASFMWLCMPAGGVCVFAKKAVPAVFFMHPFVLLALRQYECPRLLLFACAVVLPALISVCGRRFFPRVVSVMFGGR